MQAFLQKKSSQVDVVDIRLTSAQRCCGFSNCSSLQHALSCNVLAVCRSQYWTSITIWTCPHAWLPVLGALHNRNILSFSIPRQQQYRQHAAPTCCCESHSTTSRLGASLWVRMCQPCRKYYHARTVKYISRVALALYTGGACCGVHFGIAAAAEEAERGKHLWRRSSAHRPPQLPSPPSSSALCSSAPPPPHACCTCDGAAGACHNTC